ncbi:MAG: rRNA maturation RNase YbeY [Alphaproteobacteria bacterium]
MWLFFHRLKVITICDSQSWQKDDRRFLLRQLKKIYHHIPNAPPKAYIEILFTNDKHMQQLQKKFLHKNQSTNVLAFPHDPDNPADNFLGSIALGYGVIKKQSQQQKKIFHHHLLHLGLHGLLHLFHFTHKKQHEAKKMERLEILLLANIGINNPYQ